MAALGVSRRPKATIGWVLGAADAQRPTLNDGRRPPIGGVAAYFSHPLAEERGAPGAVPADPFLEHLQTGSQRGQGVGGLTCPCSNTTSDPPLSERLPRNMHRSIGANYRVMDKDATRAR
ncbi:hypothetical protein NDU88_006447 [Pleurodeles waltl]|uniref:Uncharacterized protein n=1 Tax=Pleurodeles waltl TaxID=8319 RepID=A0AAV7WAM0_PLEWA|nr:hypothetical protein NDU88_006447 [Pleurodeles waltl]